MVSIALASLLMINQLSAPDLGRRCAGDVATSGPSGGSIVFQLFV